MGDVVKSANYVGEHYGLLPVYAIIIAFAGIISANRKHLLVMLSIMGGVYVAMFKEFNLQGKLFSFDILTFLPTHEPPFGLTLDQVNKVAALVFVYVIGFTVYGVKRLAFPKEA
jgi:hypothetical protein